MDSSEKHIINRIILYKLLGAELSRDEEELFEQWLQLSSGNAELFGRIVERRIAEKYADAAININVIDKIQIVHHKVKVKKLRRCITRFSAVAAIALIVIVSAVIMTHSSIKEDFSTIAVTEQTPRAILHIANGNSVELTKDEQGEGWKKHLGSEGNNHIEENELVRITVPQGSDYHLLLSDGSQVWMNSESTIEYYTNFSGQKRKIILSGEAYFEVARDENRPFVVIARNREITVLGTSFNVSAYEDDNVITTTLVEGVVEIKTPGVLLKLTPGNQAKIDENGLITTSEVDVSLYTSWTKGVFDFENMPLKDICMKLSRWYGVKFVFSDDAGEEKFSGGAWMNAPLEDFLHNIEVATDVKFTVKNGEITLTSGKQRHG